jgi:glyceraldehyde 3-phosphate dehydrogenase
MEKKIRIGINGFGRIGRGIVRELIANSEARNIELVAINDIGPLDVLAHLFEYDSIHGKWQGLVSYEPKTLVINGHRIHFSAESEISEIGWGELGVDLVIESTGKFKSREAARGHIHAGARKVIISAVADDENIPTIVLGANEHLLTGKEDIISNASCTTNCAAPLIDIIDRLAGIESGYITTVHSYTSDQTLHDRPHTDFRRARAAAVSIIPTTTGAAKAVTKVFPSLEGKLGGAGIRVPVPNGSLTDITYIVRKQTTVEEVNAAFKSAAEEGKWKGYLAYTEKPLVSIDIVGNPHSCVYDAQLTSVIGNMVKIVGWYDNEIGYSNRIIDLIGYWSKLWD